MHLSVGLVQSDPALGFTRQRTNRHGSAARGPERADAESMGRSHPAFPAPSRAATTTASFSRITNSCVSTHAFLLQPATQLVMFRPVTGTTCPSALTSRLNLNKLETPSELVRYRRLSPVIFVCIPSHACHAASTTSTARACAASGARSPRLRRSTRHQESRDWPPFTREVGRRFQKLLTARSVSPQFLEYRQSAKQAGGDVLKSPRKVSLSQWPFSPASPCSSRTFSGQEKLVESTGHLFVRNLSPVPLGLG